MCIHETINPLLDCENCYILNKPNLHKTYTAKLVELLKDGLSPDEIPLYENFSQFSKYLELEDVELINCVLNDMKQMKERHQKKFDAMKLESEEWNRSIDCFFKVHRPSWSIKRINTLKMFI
jgi:hypothetical protein